MASDHPFTLPKHLSKRAVMMTLPAECRRIIHVFRVVLVENQAVPMSDDVRELLQPFLDTVNDDVAFCKYLLRFLRTLIIFYAMLET